MRTDVAGVIIALVLALQHVECLCTRCKEDPKCVKWMLSIEITRITICYCRGHLFFRIEGREKT